MTQWIYKLIGKKLASKLKLEDTNMADESVIPWYKSRTIWAAVVTAILGVLQPVSAAFGHPIVVPEWVLSVLIGLGLYTARTASTSIK